MNLNYSSFKSQEALFDRVWRLFPYGQKPNWRHFWFYRFLQINPRYLWARTLHKKFLAKGNIKDLYDLRIPNRDQIVFNYEMFGDVYEYDFIRWWYLYGIRMFDPYNLHPVKPHIFLRAPKSYTLVKVALDRAVRDLKSYFKSLNNNPNHQTYLIVGLPILNTKKDTLKQLDQLFSSYFDFGTNEFKQGPINIYPSKIRQATLASVYKVFELRVKYPGLTLEQLAIKANVLTGAMADFRGRDFKNAKEMNSYNSMVAGTAQQISFAINLSEGAARCEFLKNEKQPSLEPDFSLFEKIFKEIKTKGVHRNNNFKDIINFVNGCMSGEIKPDDGYKKSLSYFIDKFESKRERPPKDYRFIGPLDEMNMEMFKSGFLIY